ncbi:restriction endonuclease subunit S [Staphylococcus ursi]|uniref:restriction endonuclease subunit S n=1 Tax=Staphylococcus sp. MI 10-1553 TaxID=1912064 RepID=UPI001398B01B|nr:restriction endonuclease subunit S [Staphylococcus sp. MI 10-1553]QHW36000.1 restriction endonuclease subunit S [Staphylococcus sp. MI 10-1553]
MSAINPLIRYHSGTILNRLNPVDEAFGTPIMIYDQNMMDTDLGKYRIEQTEPKTITLKEDHNAKCITAGQIVFNMITGESVIVSSKYSGAILPYNYTHIEVDREKVYPRYLVYWLNHSPKALKQIKLYQQGGSMIKKMTHKQLQALEIPLPSMEQQKQIGDLAHSRLRLKYLKAKREHLMDTYLTAILFREER